MGQRKVVVTGAAGKVAGQVLPALRQRYELSLLDIKTTNRAGEMVEGVQVADLLDRNRDRYRQYFRGADAIVHFGFVGNSNPAAGNDSDLRFQDELANVQMAYTVYQTALEEGVRRVVVASSNHAADYYEPLILSGEMDLVDPAGRALSDNYYGWAKKSTSIWVLFLLSVNRRGPRQHLLLAPCQPPGANSKWCRSALAARARAMSLPARWAICAVCAAPWPSISATVTYNNSLSKVLRWRIFATNTGSLFKSFMASAPIRMRFGVLPMPAR